MKISLLTPTRGRPLFMERLWASALVLADKPKDVEIVFYVDEDDGKSIAKARELNTLTSYGIVKYIIGARIILSKMWNACCEISAQEIMMHCGDDIVFRTGGWDSLVRTEFQKVPDKILFVYGRDGITPDKEEFGTHGFIHGNWVKTVGYFVPPYFAYGKNDHWLTDVATMVGRKKFVPALYTEHMHHVVGKSVLDQTYKDAIQRGMEGNHRKLWEDTLDERKKDAEKLSSFVRDFKGCT